MNPYHPPASSNEVDPEPDKPAVIRPQVPMPCWECRSHNTSADSVLREKPNILAIMLFGWVFILIRKAFEKKCLLCYDCGAERRYKSTGSKAAMLILVMLISFIFLLWLADRMA